MKNTPRPPASRLLLTNRSEHRLDKRFKAERERERERDYLQGHIKPWTIIYIHESIILVGWKGGDKGLSHLWGHFCVEGPNFHYSGWNAPKRRKPPFATSIGHLWWRPTFSFRALCSHNLARVWQQTMFLMPASGMSVSGIENVAPVFTSWWKCLTH